MTLVAEKISTQGSWIVRDRSSSTGQFVTITDSGRTKARAPAKNHTAAVYSYIRAIRSAGKVSVNTAEVAAALDLPQREVRQILSGLADKGVKLR